MEQMDDKQRLAQLESRARMLEAELSGLNATIATLRARLSTTYAQPAAPAFVPVGMSPTPPPMPQQGYQTPMPPSAAMMPAAAVGIPSVPPPPQDFRTAYTQPAAPVAQPVQTEPSAVPAQEDVYLPPMSPYDSLRRKWDIGTGEQPVQDAAQPVYAAPQPEMVAQPVYAAVDPELRLFGLLTDGSPWEYRIPFSCMAAEEGVYVGRDAEYAQVILNDASVSRCHLRLELTESGIVVTDMNSTNGSVINDHVIEEYENRLPLKDGDTLTLGNVTLQAQFLQ